MTSLVTIIMATYNRAHLIMETIISIQNQTHTNFECLIIDDGGSDSTETTLAPVLKTDNRFRYLKRPETYLKGLPGSRNFGLDIGKGRYVIFFDDDDIVHPQNLELSIKVINLGYFDFCHYRKAVLCHDKMEYIKEDLISSFQINSSDLYNIIANILPLASCTVLWKFEAIGNYRFDESLMYAEEWEFYPRLISKGLTGIGITNVLYFNRKHPNSNTGHFFEGNLVQRSSKANAIFLVLKNLQKQNMLSYKLKKYILNKSYEFKELNLFALLINELSISIVERVFWQIYYFTFQYRFAFYRLKKSLLKLS